MIKGGRRHFNLAAILHFLVFGDDEAANLTLFVDQLLFLFFRKGFSLFKKSFDKGIFFPPQGIKPGQIKPSLKISPVLFFERI